MDKIESMLRLAGIMDPEGPEQGPEWVGWVSYHFLFSVGGPSLLELTLTSTREEKG